MFRLDAGDEEQQHDYCNHGPDRCETAEAEHDRIVYDLYVLQNYGVNL